MNARLRQRKRVVAASTARVGPHAVTIDGIADGAAFALFDRRTAVRSRFSYGGTVYAQRRSRISFLLSLKTCTHSSTDEYPDSTWPGARSRKFTRATSNRSRICRSDSCARRVARKRRPAPRWTAQNPPLIDSANPAISDGRSRRWSFTLWRPPDASRCGPWCASSVVRT
jgi:hypothetical protein